MVGMGVYALIYYILVLYQKVLPLNSSLLILVIISVMSGVLAYLTHTKVKYYQSSPAKLTSKEIVLLTITGLILTYIALQNWYWPPYSPDAIHLYDFRALRLLDHDIDGFFNGTKYLASKNYPPFTSLMHYFFYTFGFVNPKNGYTILLASFLLTLYGYTERLTGSRLKGILISTLTILTPSVWWNSILAMTNIPLMEYFSLAVLYLCDFKNEKGIRSSWLLSGILLGMASFIRQEAIWIPILGIGFVFGIFTRKLTKYLLMTAIFLLIANLWPISITWTTPIAQIHTETQSVLKITNNISTSDFNAAEIALKSLWKSWGSVVVAFYATIMLQFFIFRNKLLTPIQLIGAMMSISIVVGFMTFSKRFTGWSGISDAVYRMGVVVIPIFWIGIIASPVWNIIFKKKNYL